MKIHIISETEFMSKGNGVHTAYVDLVELLKENNELDIVINGEGNGDIFHSHTYGPYYFWKGRKYKGKKVLTVHVIPDSIKGSIPLWKYVMPLIKLYFKRVYSYADICIAISPMVEESIKSLGVKTKILKLYNPLPIERWQRTEEKRRVGRQRLNLSDSDFVVLGVGQIEGRKGVEDFIDVATAIPEAKFVWIGGRPFGILTEGITRINAKIKKAPSNVQFIGMVDLMQMPFFYAAGDLLLFPSYQENCPLAPIEAAASGIPVIFRDIKEYSLLYECPYLKCGSLIEFIAITKLLIHNSEFYKTGLSYSKKIINQFDKKYIRRKLIELYEELNKY